MRSKSPTLDQVQTDLNSVLKTREQWDQYFAKTKRKLGYSNSKDSFKTKVDKLIKAKIQHTFLEKNEKIDEAR